MKRYRVGGAVRDELLGRPLADVDWVVVGATPDAMVAAGYRPVGRDFPVFLHPETREEHALARTERKEGRGYHGFVWYASPEVTLEEDLRRRDLTINAMARDEEGRLVDPFGGQRDLAAGVLRHVSPAFAEDPLRVLRVARFASRFGFVVAQETEALMRELVDSGELTLLSPERVWQELARGLCERWPSRMLGVLRSCGALEQVLPEVDALYGVPQPPLVHPEVDAGVHIAQALDYCAGRDDPLVVRYAVLAHDLGKGTSPVVAWPGHLGHETRGVVLADRMSARLRVPAECRDAAVLAARWHGVVHRALELRPATVLDLLAAADAFRRPGRLHGLLAACSADVCSRPGRPEYPQAASIEAAFAAARAVDAGAIAAGIALRYRQRGEAVPGDAIAQAVRRARLAALRAR